MTGRPVYQEIADDLSEQIVNGVLTPGQRIPSRSELKTLYGASDQTVDRAVRILKTGGLVEGQFGRGVFVRERTVLGALDRTPAAHPADASPFAADILAKGMKPNWEASSLTASASPRIAARLGIAPGEPVMCTEYEYTADRQPVQLATSWEPLAVTEGTDVLFPERGPYSGRGVRTRMAVLGITGLTARESIGARPATSDEAEALGCPPGSPVITVERTYVAPDGRAVETADLVIRSDRWRLAYTVPAPPGA